MSDKIIFTEDERDCLQELMNIAYGNATAVLADLLEQFAQLHIPKFEIYTPPELHEYLIEKCNNYSHYAKQPFNGEFAGETMLFLGDTSIQNLATMLNPEGDPSINNSDVTLEMMNILNSTLISRLAGEMGTSVAFLIPSMDRSSELHKRVDDLIANYSQVIVIHTIIEFEEQEIHGEIAIFTKDESLVWIHDTVAKITEEMMQI